MEYLHHIYDICRFKLSQKYVFVVPIEFEDIKSKMVWPAADNVTFDFISETEKQPMQIPACFYNHFIYAKF